MDTLNITVEIVGAILLIAGFLWAVARGVIKLVRFGIRVERSLIAVETQLRPNGGESLRDRVDQLATQHNQIMSALATIERRVSQRERQ